MDNQFDLTIQQLLKDIPQNSSIQFWWNYLIFQVLKRKAGKYMDPYSLVTMELSTYALSRLTLTKMILLRNNFLT